MSENTSPGKSTPETLQKHDGRTMGEVLRKKEFALHQINLTPFREVDVYSGCPKNDRGLLSKRLHRLVRSCRMERVVIRGTPWYIPIVDTEASP